MDQDTNRKRKCSGLKNILCFFTSKEEQEAQLLDDMQKLSEISPNSNPPSASPGEFNNIMAEMERRGIKPKVSRQARRRGRILWVRRALHKPAVIGLMVLIILSATSAGVAAKKSYNYRMREKRAGKSNIVLNNDQYVLTEADDLDEAYIQIEESMEIKPLKMKSKPFDMKFVELKIEAGSAVIRFKYDENSFYFVQAKSPITTSRGMASDREKLKPINNIYLNETLYIEKNKLEDNVVEYSMSVELNGVYYSLEGVISEKEFVNIIENLSF